jgi:hypothetical protein
MLKISVILSEYVSWTADAFLFLSSLYIIHVAACQSHFDKCCVRQAVQPIEASPSHLQDAI